MNERRERKPEASTIRDSATAVAAAKCVINRDLGGASLGKISGRFFHPSECAFCEMEVEWLRAAVAEFNEWAGLNDPDRIDPAFPDMTPIQPSVESFMLLPMEEQQIRVQRAQGYR